MIQVQDLQKVTGQNLAIDIPSFTVEAGEIVALVGAVGSGKEPLLDLLLGRSRPTVGRLTVDGLDPAEDKEAFSHQVGVLFEEDGLYKNQSPLTNLAFHCKLHGLPKARAQEVLAQVGLADRANLRVEKLPSGLARRLAFGRAILHRPRVLLLVEPFARCDEASIALLHGLLRTLAKEQVAILILAADDANLRALCDTIYALEKGRIVESYRPEEEQRAALPFKIPVRLEGRVVLVNPGDIFYAGIEEGQTFLCTREGSLPAQFTLIELEERLARSGFFRAHRGYLVNLQHVKEVIPYTRNSFSLVLNDGHDTEIPLSKAAAHDLRELLGY